jgi:hypothetical protein
MMEMTPQIAITPEQLAAVQAGHGVAFAQDPHTQRVFLLIEQEQTAIPLETLQAKLAEGLAESEHGESIPWDVESQKAQLLDRHTKRKSSSS